MNSLSNKRVLTVLLVLFPPLMLLVYAIVSYAITYYTQQETVNKIERSYITTRKNKNIQSIKIDTVNINNYINKVQGNKEKIFEFLDNFSNGEFENILILEKNNELIYNKNTLAGLEKIYNIAKKLKDGFYRTDGYTFDIISKNILRYKIIVYSLDNQCDQKYREELQTFISIIASVYGKYTATNLLWLAIIFLILLVFSVLLSMLIYKKLTQHEKSIELTGERVIFQSRQALLGELLPMIAHQWRQPLNKIAAVLMRMRFEISGGNPRVERLDMQCQKIENSVELMSQTIEDFRTFYRPKELPEEADLSLYIRKSLYFLEELLNRKKITIHSDLTPVKIKLHANEFLQVMINLVKNATDAVDVQGHISIKLKELPDGSAEIRVEDDGTGIPKEKLEKIFEPHESSKQGSMGLGLYMNRIIVEQHFNGKIKAYNTNKGAGFYIFIPKEQS